MGLGIFKKPNYRIKKRICKTGWRKPRGIDSKQKKKLNGFGLLPKIGYRKSKKYRDLHPSGMIEVRIFNLNELDECDPKEHIIRIASCVGKKKKNMILKLAEEKGFRIINR